MKSLTLAFLSLPILVFSSLALAQPSRLVVVPNKIEYVRTGANVPDYKKTFDVRYPVIKGSFVAKKKIERQIDYWRVFQMSFRENLRDDHWLSSFDYEVKYNDQHVFAIWLTTDGVGAYPDSGTKYFVFDTRTGKRLAIKDLFTTLGMKRLRGKLRLAMAKELKDNPDGKTQYELQAELYGEEFHPAPKHLELRNLDGFSIAKDGITFMFDYGFPHVTKATQPPGKFFFSWKQLKPLIKSRGLLAQVAK